MALTTGWTLAECMATPHALAVEYTAYLDGVNAGRDKRMAAAQQRQV